MPCQSIVRIAGPADLQEIWRLFLAADKENGLYLLAPDKVNFFLNRMLNHDQIPEDDPGIRGIIGVIGEEGSLEAMAGICIASVWYSHELHLGDFLVFVDPEHRASDHAKALVGWMKHQSDIIGIPLMSGVVSNKRTEEKCRLYKRMIPKVGEYFFYNGHRDVTAVSSGVPSQTTH